MKILEALLLLVLIMSANLGGPPDLAIEGLRPAYESLEDVHITLRNVGEAPLWLDPYNLDRIVVYRRTESGEEWEEGDSFRCLNGGSGNPRMIAPGGTVKRMLLESSAFQVDGAPLPYFRTKDWQKRPISGRYRLVVHYSRVEWTFLFQISSSAAVLEVESDEFTIGEADNKRVNLSGALARPSRGEGPAKPAKPAAPAGYAQR